MDPTTTTTARPRSRRRRTRWNAGLLTLGLACGTAWGLDRYVVEHVEIADVAAYGSAQVAADDAAQDASGAATTSGTASAGTSTDASATHAASGGRLAPTLHTADPQTPPRAVPAGARSVEP